MICLKCNTDIAMQMTVLKEHFLHECTECGWHIYVRRSAMDEVPECYTSNERDSIEFLRTIYSVTD